MIAARTGLSRKTVSNTITIVLNHLRTVLSKHGLGAWLLGVIGLLTAIFKKCDFFRVFLLLFAWYRRRQHK